MTCVICGQPIEEGRRHGHPSCGPVQSGRSEDHSNGQRGVVSREERCQNPIPQAQPPKQKGALSRAADGASVS